jgi:hypothetical protein
MGVYFDLLYFDNKRFKRLGKLCEIWREGSIQAHLKLF